MFFYVKLGYFVAERAVGEKNKLVGGFFLGAHTMRNLFPKQREDRKSISRLQYLNFGASFRFLVSVEMLLRPCKPDYPIHFSSLGSKQNCEDRCFDVAFKRPQDSNSVFIFAAECRFVASCMQVQTNCHREYLNGQDQIQQSLDGHETGLRKELGELQAQIQGLTVTPGCCGQINDLSQRTLLLEESIKGLTESQRQVQTTLSEQTIHLETILDTRLLDVEERLNITEQGKAELDVLGGGMGSLDGFKTLLEDKLKSLEERVFVAVEELSNATSPALLEGQVVPALGTEIENIRRRMEAGLDGVQKQLTDLELLCTSACSPAPSPDAALIQMEMEDCKEMEKKISERLDTHTDMLDRLNGTLQGLLVQIAQEDQEGLIQGEITLLKINVNSVNRTLKGLRDSMHLFTHEMSHVNSTWQERQHRLATQVHGIADLVGQQGALLGAGERRLVQLKGELQGLRRKLSGELQGCRGTALVAHREVMGVESRVAQVEGQCNSLGELADQLERIRAELESHSDSYLAQVNGTLASHTQQLAQLKNGLQECVNKTVQ